MPLRPFSSLLIPDVPVMEHVEIDLRECNAGDLLWIQRITTAARPHCRGRVHLNAVAYAAAKQWFAEMDIPVKAASPVDEWELPCFWEFVNGTALDTPMGRVVLLPDTVLDLEECLIPREWIDIPAWRPDYFMAIQVLEDQEAATIKLWGYACARAIAKDTFDPFMGTYSIDRTQMVEDVTTLAALPAKAPRAVSLAEPQPVAAELVQQIASGEILLPRLGVSFDDWSQLLSQPRHRLHLFLACHPRRLGLWLRAREYAICHSLQEVWQELTPLFTPSTDFRWGALRTADSPTSDRQLSAPASKEILAAQEQLRQFRIDPSNPEVRAALQALIADPLTEELRWQAAELLHDQNDPLAGSWKVREIDLGITLEDQSLALTLAVLPRASQSADLFVRVTPLNANSFLPPGLTLEIVTETGDRFAQLTSRAKDQVVQYKFWGEIGETFGIIVGYGGAKITESFVV